MSTRPPEKGAATGAATLGGALAGAAAAAPEAAASDAMRDGMDLFRAAAAHLENVGVAQKKGNLFEYIEAARFNTAAARQGAGVQAQVTAAMGRPTDPADILITRHGVVEKQVQAKASVSTTTETSQLSQARYDGMGKLVPSDHADTVRRKAGALATRHAEHGKPDAGSFRDTAEQVDGQLRHAGVSSGGTTLAETIDASENPRWFALKLEVVQVGREAVVTGAMAASAGALVGGALAAARHGMAWKKGEVTGAEAAKAVAVDAGKAGARSGAVGALGTVVRHGGAKAGIGALTKSNVATAVAAATIEIGGTVYAFARGEIGAAEAAERIGKSGSSTASGVFVGAAAGAVFGPVGAVVGSMAGYLVAASVYQGGLAILRDARLSTEEAARVVALCQAAVASLAVERQAFEQAVTALLRERDAGFRASFEAIDIALVGSRPDDVANGLADLAALCGRRLEFPGFEAFDAFMLADEGPLVI